MRITLVGGVGISSTVVEVSPLSDELDVVRCSTSLPEGPRGRRMYEDRTANAAVPAIIHPILDDLLTTASL
jgi:hypothetical protein